MSFINLMIFNITEWIEEVEESLSMRVNKFDMKDKLEILQPVDLAPMVALFSARGPNIKDYKFQDADLLKPDILAPGSLIWSSWSANGTHEANYEGENFAMISGTSIAAPHIVGIATLIKQKHPHWSPAVIKSALMTTSSTLNRAERPILAKQNSGSETMTFVPATPFDYGSGHVNEEKDGPDAKLLWAQKHNGKGFAGSLSLYMWKWTMKMSKSLLPIILELLVENAPQAFGEGFYSDTFKPFYKSDPIPQDNDGDVKIVFGNNFDNIVLDESKDVLLEICAPSFRHCQALEPTYSKLAKHLREIDSLVNCKDGWKYK